MKCKTNLSRVKFGSSARASNAQYRAFSFRGLCPCQPAGAVPHGPPLGAPPQIPYRLALLRSPWPEFKPPKRNILALPLGHGFLLHNRSAWNLPGGINNIPGRSFEILGQYSQGQQNCGTWHQVDLGSKMANKIANRGKLCFLAFYSN